jgi:CSLREA domain-containing protein
MLRIFTITTGTTVNISDLTLAHGRAADGTGTGTSNGTPGEDGGGIKNSGTLNLTGVRVTGNRAGEGGCSCAQSILGGRGGNGGGIFNDGTLTLVNSSVTNNAAGTGGLGNLLTSGGGQGGAGGGIYNTGSLSIVSSTISGNRSGVAGAFGGKAGLGAGIYGAGATNVITNSTLSGNSVGPCPNPDIISNGNPTSCGGHIAFGGGLYATAAVTVSSSTIAFNIADEGGGIYQNGAANVTLRNTIVARNSATTGADLRNTFSSEGFNLIQNTGNATINQTQNTGSNLTAVDPNLGPLAANGGPTETHSLRFDSPALDKGNSFGVLTDQRGLPRPIDLPSFNNAANGDASDIGAVEQQNATFDITPPQVSSIVRGSANPTTANTTVDFIVTFSEPVVGVDPADFVVTSSGSSSGASVTNISGTGATRTVSVDTGSVTLNGNGTGEIRLDVVDNDSIVDFSNNPLGGSGAGNGNFNSGESYTVTFQTLLVTKTADTNDGTCDADCSLREAVTVANTTAGAQVITFQIPSNDPGCSGGVCTIELQSASAQDGNSGLTLIGDVVINGTGATHLKLKPASGQRFRILKVSSGTNAVISGLTFTGGLPPNAPRCNVGNSHGIEGGGILNAGTLTLSDMIISGNKSSNGGNCGNAAGGDGGAGGGIFNSGGASLTIANSTISDNLAGDAGNNDSSSSGSLGGVGGSGGGISNDGSITIINSTLNGNRSGKGGNKAFGGSGSTGGDGGGIFNFSGATLVVTNSTISGNQTGDGGSCTTTGTAGSGGNGAGINNRSNATLTLSNSTVSFNTVGNGGTTSNCSGAVRGRAGGIDSGSSATSVIRSSLISNNIGEGGSDARGPFHSQGFNLLLQANDGQFTIFEDQNPGTNIYGVDPLLAALSDNGGPTRTHALQGNSPAIDKGKNFATDASNNALNTDQRGEQRPLDLPAIANVGGGDGSDIGAYELKVAPVHPGDLLISEFRTRGPAGSADEYVKVYNNTDSDINIFAINQSAGFLVFTDNNRNCLIPNGTVIRARGYFLCTGASYSLSSIAAGDASFSGDVLDGRGIGIFSKSQQLTSNDKIDQVGTNQSTFGFEGTALPQFTSTPTEEYAWMRDLSSGRPKDTNNNAVDFVLVSTTGGLVGGLQSTLGAPGPQSSTSPLENNLHLGLLMLDQTVGQSTAPNRLRDLVSDPANNSTFGTITIRRRIVNSTGAPVTRLRFRIINITAFPVVDPTLADVRVRTSVDQVVNGINDSATCGPNPTPCSVTVRGLTLESPPQPNGGALNSTLSAGTISLGTPLANGDSISVQFLLGVQKSGIFRFFVNVEALP